MWDLAKPIFAQIHGRCLAGGSELATACDLVYVAEDAKIGYQPARLMSPPPGTGVEDRPLSPG
jgi:enoyl-CoA hydratase